MANTGDTIYIVRRVTDFEGMEGDEVLYFAHPEDAKQAFDALIMELVVDNELDGVEDLDELFPGFARYKNETVFISEEVLE
jgi:hypothetical protein